MQIKTQQHCSERQVTILDALPVHICLVDKNGTIVAVNEKWKQFALENGHRSDGFFIGSNYLEVCDGSTGEFSDLAKEAAEGLRNVLTGKSNAFEMDYPCHSETEKRWFRLMIIPLNSNSRFGNAAALLQHTNITESVLVKRRFQSLIKHSSDTITLLDVDGKIIYVSPSTSRTLGYSSDDVIGGSIFELIHEDDLKPVAEQFEGVKSQPHARLDIQCRVRHKDGSFRWLEGTATNLLDEVSVGAIALNYRDVTERKHTELESQVISEIIQGATRTSNLDQLFSIIHQSLKKVLYAENCFIGLYDKKTGMMNLPFFADQYGHAPTSFKLKKQKSAYVFNHDRPMLMNRQVIRELARRKEIELRSVNAASWLGVPLRTPGETIGVLVVQHYEDENAYSQRDLDFLTSVGNQIALIIERRRVEEAVQNSYDHLDAIINAVPDPIFVKDKNHRWVLVNTAMCLLLGQFAEDLIGKSDYDFFPQEEADVFWEKDEKVFASGEEDINEEIFTDTVGVKRTILTRKCLYIDENNEPFIVGIIRDITDRKESELELDRTKQFLQKVIDNVPNLIFVKNHEGRFILVNQAYADFQGLPVKEIIGKTSADLIKNDKELAIIEKYDRQALRKVHKNTTFEHKVTDVWGETHWFHTVKRSFIASGENLPSLLGVATDLTERKLLEEQLQQAQKLKSIGQLAAGIAHEINTPTQFVGDNTHFLRDAFNDLATVLKKNTELLDVCRAQSLTDRVVTEMEEAIKFADVDYLLEEIPKAVQQVLNGVERIGKIVQSMKDFAHPGIDRKQATDLNRAIESTVTVARNEWKYVADLELDFDPNLPPVPCLVSEFNQVILNMIVNAAHAIAEVVGDGSRGKGTIKISTKFIKDWAEIRISDSGAGIPEDIRQKIFEPFFTTKEVGKGTGQGLAISHSVIVEKHGGTIALESRAENGTTFIIRLPLDDVTDSDLD